MRNILMRIALAIGLIASLAIMDVQPSAAEHSSYDNTSYIGFAACGAYHLNVANMGTGDFYGSPGYHNVTAYFYKQGCSQDIGAKVCAYDQGAIICADVYVAAGGGTQAYVAVAGHCSSNWCDPAYGARDEFDYLASTYRQMKSGVCEWYDHDPWSGMNFTGSTTDTGSLACPWAYAYTAEPQYESAGETTTPHYI